MSNPAEDDPGDKMQFGDLYWKMTKAFLYHVIRILFNIIRTMLWLLNGTYYEYVQSMKPEDYDTSAQVFNILYRYKFDLILGQASFEDFILGHDCFVHPMYLLKDECILYQVTKTHAIFVEVDKGVDVWRGQYGSFLRQAEFLQAKQVITLPLHAMERLGSEVGDTPAKMIFVQNTSRCGSTLLVRIFEETRKCVTFCEPDAVNGICKLAETKKLWDEETQKKMVRSLVRLMCKPVKSFKEPPLAYILKMTAPTMEAAPFLAESFPEAYHYFMYRDCLKICQSLAVAAEEMPTLKQLYLLGSISAKGLAFGISQMGCSSNEWNIQISGHPFEPGILVYAITIRKYHEMLENGIKIAGIRYEDLAGDPEYCITQILQYCRLPISLLIPALNAMGKDAQKHSALNTENLKQKKKNYKLNPVVQTFMEQTFHDYGVPLDPAPVLKNTITHKYCAEQTNKITKGPELSHNPCQDRKNLRGVSESNSNSENQDQNELKPKKNLGKEENHEESDQSSSSSFEVLEKSGETDMTRQNGTSSSVNTNMVPKLIKLI